MSDLRNNYGNKEIIYAKNGTKFVKRQIGTHRSLLRWHYASENKSEDILTNNKNKDRLIKFV